MTACQRIWRIATQGPTWRRDDLNGLGAAHDPGRWNALGLPTVYASSSIALACLETLVHLTGDQGLPLRRWLVAIDVSAAHWQQRCSLTPDALPGWDARPPDAASIQWGSRWLTNAEALVAVVPSVIVPEECNVLINPAHPGSSALKATVLRPWSDDPRLI